MHADHAAEAPLITVPPDLLAELKRRGKKAQDFHVEGWKPSVFERLMARLTGRK